MRRIGVMYRMYCIPVLQEQKTGYVKQQKWQSQAMRNGFSGYSLKANSYPLEVDIAHLWKFADGKIVDFLEIFDSAKAVAVATE